MRVARNRIACLPSPRRNLTAIRPLPYRTLVDASSLTNEAVADMLASTIAKLPEVHVCRHTDCSLPACKTAV